MPDLLHPKNSASVALAATAAATWCLSGADNLQSSCTFTVTTPLPNIKLVLTLPICRCSVACFCGCVRTWRSPYPTTRFCATCPRRDAALGASCSVSRCWIHRFLQVDSDQDCGAILAAGVQQAFLPKFHTEDNDASVADAIVDGADERCGVQAYRTTVLLGPVILPPRA